MDKNELRNYINKNCFDKNNKLKISYKLIIKDLIKFENRGKSNLENLYLFYYNENPSKCYCGNNVNFKSFSKGYFDYCSPKCSNNSKSIKNKKIQSYLKHYGVENPSQAKIIKEKKASTLLGNYGIKSQFELESSKKTMLTKYGTANAMQNTTIQDKTRKTMLSKYGVEYPYLNKEIIQNVKEKNKKSKFNKLFHLSNIKPLFNYNNYDGVKERKKYKFLCKICNTRFEDHLYSHIPRCPTCYPKNQPTSKLEKEVVSYIKSLNISLIENDRKILGGKELDIYIPSHNLAIEFNGLYWHSELNGKDRNYHLNKTIECEKQDIQLLHIFEDEWHDKQDIIKNIIKIKLGLIDKRIYGRKTVIEEIDNQEDFLNTNHIQGYISAKVNLGLYYEDELISLLTFSKSRFNKKYDWEILRYVNLTNTSVIGGFAKMLKYFRKEYEGSIITYSDRRLFDGGIYESNGFKKLEFTKPGYYYFKNRRRYNRQQFMKHKLEKKLDTFDPSLTEWENMQLNGYDRIWDVGNYKWILK